MTARITRRLVLIALPAASAASALPVAAPETPSSAQRLFHEWSQAIAAEQAAYDAEESEEHCAQLGQARTALEDRLMNAPSQCPRDLLCKIAAYTNFGLFALPESVYRSEIARIEDLRTRQAAYRACLPTTHEAATKEASSVLRTLIEEDEGGQLLEAMHLSIALGAMIQKDGNALGYEGTYRDAAMYVSEKVADALRHVHGELEHMDHVLRSVNGTG